MFVLGFGKWKYETTGPQILTTPKIKPLTRDPILRTSFDIKNPETLNSILGTFFGGGGAQIREIQPTVPWKFSAAHGRRKGIKNPLTRDPRLATPFDIKNPETLNSRLGTFFGGGGGIRTHGALSNTTVFKTAALNRSATPPNCTN